MLESVNRVVVCEGAVCDVIIDVIIDVIGMHVTVFSVGGEVLTLEDSCVMQ